MSEITNNEVAIADESDVALWYCRECFRSGVLLLNKGSVYSVIEALIRVHRAVSKDACDVNIGSLRLIKPSGWHGSATADLRNDDKEAIKGGQAK